MTFNIEVSRGKSSWMAFAMPKDIFTCRAFVTKHQTATNNEYKYKIRVGYDKCKTATRLRQCVARTKKLVSVKEALRVLKFLEKSLKELKNDRNYICKLSSFCCIEYYSGVYYSCCS